MSRDNPMPRTAHCLLVVTLSFSAAFAQAATPVYRSSFDKHDQGWTVVRGCAAADASVLHENNTSIRLERDPAPGAAAQDASVRLATVPLTMGKRYELSGWVRTEGLEGRDLDRTPLATGATV